MSSIRSVDFGSEVCVQCIDRFPVIFHISRVRQGKESILNIGSREPEALMHVSSACCSRCLHLELSLCRLQIVRTLSTTAPIANQACFGPQWQSNVLIWFRSLSSMFLANFSSRGLLGVLFYPRRQCCGRSSRQITKDYNGLELKR